MKGANGCMLYAGKAVGLRKRLSSYLLDSKTLHRKVEMIARIGSIEVMLVRNEREV